jgi:fructose-bisphosphate aldolase class II
MLVTNKFLLQKANKGNYAVGAFNINNMEFLQAIINAAEKLKSPAIVQTTEGAIKYAGLVYLHSLVTTAAKYTKTPISLHLDHGRDLDIIKQCIKIGYTSVMIDGSHYDFEKNIRVTKKVVSLAHKKGVSVEAELGTIGGVEEDVSARKIIYTDPGAALEFVKRTGVDTLAVAIGTSHGAYKFAGKSKLDIKRLKEIKKKLKIPLVLHGGSGIPADIISKAKKYGAKFGKPKGVSDFEMKKAVRNGINKVNIDSDLRLSFTAAVREVLAKKPEEFDPRKILSPARAFIQKTVEHKMKLFGSAGRI